MARRRTQIVQDAYNGMLWQAKYFDPEIGRWFDIGDGKATREEAQQVLDESNAADQAQQ